MIKVGCEHNYLVLFSQHVNDKNRIINDLGSGQMSDLWASPSGVLEEAINVS